MKRLTALAVMASALGGLIFISPAPARPTVNGNCPQSENGVGPASPDQLSQPLNYVVLQECQGGAEQGLAETQIRNASGQDQPTNYVYAYSHDCSSPCESLAAGFQVILMQQGSQNQAPQNAGLGVNESCNGCVSYAFADQYVVDVPPGTRLPDQTRRQIAQIGQQAQSDVNSALGFSDPKDALSNLDSQLRALASQEHQDVLDGLKQDDVHDPPHHDAQGTKGEPSPAPGPA